MATWEQKTVNSTFDADTYMYKADIARKVTKKSTKDSTSYFSRIGVVGINASKVSSMIKAMDDYISAINKEIDKMNTSANSQQAFKGNDLKEALNKYLQKVESYLKAMTSQLKAFEDKLVDVKTAWEKAQSNQGSAINKASSSFASVSTYQRKKQ